MILWFPAVPELASESVPVWKRPPSWTGMKMGFWLRLCHFSGNPEGRFSSGSEKASVPLDPNSQEEVWTVAWEKSKDLPFRMLSEDKISENLVTRGGVMCGQERVLDFGQVCVLLPPFSSCVT